MPFDKDQVGNEVAEIMADRGYDLDKSLNRVSAVTGIALDEVKKLARDQNPELFKQEE
jgi:hypothetical protein